jgi:hypothetical protein
VVWSLNLRHAHPHAAAIESVHIYANPRQRQLRASLRELRLAQWCTDTLACAVAALIATALWTDAEWFAACRLAVAAVLWWLLCGLYLRRARTRNQWEYRAMKRLSKR